MTALVLGPNGSGKSAYAETLAARFSTSFMYYIATMVPFGTEGQSRVEKHRKQREALGFITVEKSRFVSDISLESDAVVLLEDVSNLLSNAMFDVGAISGDVRQAKTGRGFITEGDFESVFCDITALCESCSTAVLVSIDGLIAMSNYDGETRTFIESLNRLNYMLADFADIVIEMRGGEPIIVKGGANALD